MYTVTPVVLATLTTPGEVGGPLVRKPPPLLPGLEMPELTALCRFVSKTTSVSGSTERGASTALPSAELAPQPDNAAASEKQESGEARAHCHARTVGPAPGVRRS